MARFASAGMPAHPAKAESNGSQPDAASREVLVAFSGTGTAQTSLMACVLLLECNNIGPSQGLFVPITLQHTQESLCLAHIYALAGMAGVNYGIRHVYDYGVDGQFNPVVERDGRLVDSGFPLDFQAKATINWERKNGCIVYDLEAKTYNDIVSRTPAETTLILILLCLPSEQAHWHMTNEDSTTLRNCCYWHSFDGELTENENTRRVYIPAENLLTPTTLNELLALEKARRQNQTI